MVTDNSRRDHETRLPDAIYPALSPQRRRDILMRALQHPPQPRNFANSRTPKLERPASPYGATVPPHWPHP